MPQSKKHFAERLNNCLDDTGAPIPIRERAVVLSKMINIPKQQAWSLLGGQLTPDDGLIRKIADEFEVDPEWLCCTK